MSEQQSNFLRHDLITVGVLVVIVAAVMFGLWYADQRYGTFTNLAHWLLDPGS